MYACCSLNRYHYGGIGCCVVGITLVGVSSMLSGEHSARQMAEPAAITLLFMAAV
jgi:hypothetical protein